MSRKEIYSHTLLFDDHNETVEHVKWCRRNLGERGSDWDFTGSKNIHVVIYNPKYALFYKLKFE